MTDREQSFTLTDEHLMLLRAMYVDWDDCEFGAPAIDPKRPYGNSDVLGDIAEILGLEIDYNTGLKSTEADQLSRLHKETQTALQILLQLADIQPGEYVGSRYGFKWERVKKDD